MGNEDWIINWRAVLALVLFFAAMGVWAWAMKWLIYGTEIGAWLVAAVLIPLIAYGLIVEARRRRRVRLGLEEDV